MRVLVTGAASNLGRRLVKRLEDAGAEVWRAMREPPEGPRCLHFELREPESIRAAVKTASPDRVLHLAAWVDVGSSFQDPIGVYETNVIGTARLLEALHATGSAARFLYLSTSHVYGIPPEGTDLVTESTPTAPVSPYAASKLASENLVLLYSRISRIEPVVVRLFNMVGAGLPRTSVCRALAERVLGVAQGKEQCPLKVGNLSGLRDFIATDDAMDGIVAALEKGKSGETYNLCTGRGISIGEILEELARLAGVKITTEVDPALLRKVDPPRVVGDPAKLARDTGFAPGRPVEDAIAALYKDVAG